MDFTFSEEQQMLAESVRRYLDDHHDFARRRQQLASGDTPRVWSGLAGLGAVALLVPEPAGGLGGAAVDVLVVARELGRRLVVAPFMESAVVATRALAEAGSPEQQSAWLGRLATGEVVLVPVLAGTPAAPGDTVRVTGDATGGYTLQGVARAVYHAPAAAAFVVAASSGGDVPESLFLVPADATGLLLDRYPTVDSAPAADLHFDAVKLGAASRLPGATADGIAALADLAVFTLCAEALGSMDEAIQLTIDYTRQRQQFGRALASFQVLQHRMVDMQTQVEQARSVVLLAASLVDGADAMARRQAVAAAKVLAGDAARYVGQQAVQLHGGMGVTDEMAISHHFRQLTALTLRGGSTTEHLDRYRDAMIA
ncbi:MAG: acyl-CoA dehydrogenase family protein [Gammaproteobacteria bacterium]